MGLLRFLVPRRERLPATALERAYCAGMDEIPWQSRTQLTDYGLAIRRAEGDSGCFYIPWRSDGRGELLLSTATLVEREEPYHLTVELARGTLNRLRNQAAAWQQSGLVLPADLDRQMAVARVSLSRAVTGQADPLLADAEAQQSINAGLEAIDALGREYAEQALTLRRRSAGKSATLLGVNLGTSPLSDTVLQQLPLAFNAANVPLSWCQVERQEGRRDWTLSDRQIEWCRSKGLKVSAGPLVQFDRSNTPDWLYLWERDDENLMSFTADYLRAAVARYRGKVHVWHCAARLNTEDVFSLSEEQRLRMAVLAIEVIREADTRAPVVLWIDQPWAEFMTESECDLSPLHFADALVRADMGLSGIGLELNVGYWPGGTSPRDLLQFSRLLDRYAMLGLPLIVMLTLPSSNEVDSAPRGPTQPQVYAAAEGASEATQRQWIEQFVPMLLAKQPVQGIYWNQLSDRIPHGFPHAGLFDASGLPKPALEALRSVRQKYVG